jgi:hypothetical protein
MVRELLELPDHTYLWLHVSRRRTARDDDPESEGTARPPEKPDRSERTATDEPPLAGLQSYLASSLAAASSQGRFGSAMFEERRR